MLVDCLFLSYLLGGTMKWIRTKHGERIPPLRDARGLRDHALGESPEGDGPALPGLPARPRHHLLVLHARPRAGPQARGASTRSIRTVGAWTARAASCATSSGGGPWRSAKRRSRPRSGGSTSRFGSVPSADRVTLIDEAGRRFDLTPLDAGLPRPTLRPAGSGTGRDRGPHGAGAGPVRPSADAYVASAGHAGGPDLDALVEWGRAARRRRACSTSPPGGGHTALAFGAFTPRA